MHLSLSGRARQATSELELAELESVDGVTRLSKKLDRVFLQDANWKCFNAYLSFENLKKKPDQSVDEFLSEFDLHHYRLKDCGVSLPEAIVACRLIKSCNLSDVNFKLCLSTVPKMTFEDMRSTLKKIFSDVINKDIEGDRFKVTLDPVSVVNPTDDNAVMYASDGNRKYYSRPRGFFGDGRPRRGFHGGRSRSRGDGRNNPVGPDGKISVCLICGSRMHWARNCPHAYEKVKDNGCEEVQITLMAVDVGHDNLDLLLSETLGYTLLDTGCSKTVCGSLWLNCFLDSLSKEEQNNIIFSESYSTYKFGNGKRFKSLKCVRLPCELAGTKVFILTDVIDAKIPLLLSKSSMKTARMVIDLDSDEVCVLGKKIKAEITSLGHYILPLLPVGTDGGIENILLNIDNEDLSGIALKLHKQFGHAPFVKIKKLLINADYNDADLFQELEKVINECDTCKRFKKPNCRPIVALPMAEQFNDVVAMDLKLYEGVWFFVMVDLFTRYCSAVVIHDKKPDTIVRKLFENWICIFGAPKKFLSDNGGEFNNDIFRSLAENYGIRVMCTAAEAPWSNGVCEKLNHLLGISVQKIQNDVQCCIEIALAWAVSARNALHNYRGFSPNQLVFGNNPVFPSVLDQSPTILEMKTHSKVVADNINAMHAARIEFIRNESSEKLRRALLNNIRDTDVNDIDMGDTVYYKRNNSDKWRGPGKVIGRDGKQVLVKHGGVYVRVHICRLQYSGNVASEVSDILPIQDQLYPEGINGNSVETDPIDNSSTCDDDDVIVAKPNVSNPKIGDRIEFFIKDDNLPKYGTVLSRAGKVGGLYSNCFNIKLDNGDIDWVDFRRNVDRWESVNERESLLMLGPDEVFEAKLKEWKNWQQNGVYTEVEDIGQDLISVRWVLTEKVIDGVKVIKARLVARGFEEYSTIQSDSPTCSKDALRMSLSLISSFDWCCFSLDIKTAYLQGDEIKRDVWLKPPKEFNNGKVWKLNKTVYGLNDAARAWYLTLKRILIDLGLIVCKLDPALIFWFINDSLHGIICIHVDDLIWAGTDDFKTLVIMKLDKTFCVGSVACGKFKYLGVDINQQDNVIFVSQKSYVAELSQLELDKMRAQQRQDSLSAHEKRELQVKVGMLNWLSTQTRPDISFDVCDLSSRISKANVEDIHILNKVIRKAKTYDVSLPFRRLSNLDRLIIECYSDASFGNLLNGGSQGGYVIYISDVYDVRNVVSWQSRRIKRVVKSTLAAETMALLEAAEAGVYIGTMISQALNVSRPLVKCFVDNRSLCEAVYSSKNIDDKMLRINMAALRDMLSSGQICSVSWVKSAHQLANVLTKRGVNPSDLLNSL